MYTKKIYTLPQIFNKQNDENFVSDWLAFILNPDINGIGISPLVALCKHFYHKDIEDKSICIKREELFFNGQKTDITIRIGRELLICIENKISANEVDSQTTKYAYRVKRIAKQEKINKFLFIFLKPEWNKSTPESKDFNILTYSTLVSLMRQIPAFNIKTESGRFHMSEFVLYVDTFLSSNELALSDSLKEKTTDETKTNNKQISKAREFNTRLANDIITAAFDKSFTVKYMAACLRFVRPLWDAFGFHYELVHGAKGKTFCELDADDKVWVVIHQEKVKYREDFFDYLHRRFGAIPDYTLNGRIATLANDEVKVNFSSGDENDYKKAIQRIRVILQKAKFSRYVELANAFCEEYF